MKNRVRPRIPSGFLELLPEDQIVFNWMVDVIREVYERFGYLPIETPAVELKEILFVKGGGETEKQVYRLFSKSGETDMCLHFDLTVPLARYVAQYSDKLTFPFRRYQIQKVWRGEGAQKGRYREFYQCDIDVIGCFGSLVDAEIPSVIDMVFTKLGLSDFVIKISNRKILTGYLRMIDFKGTESEVLSLIDKLEKIGFDIFQFQLVSMGNSEDQVNQLFNLISNRFTEQELFGILRNMQNPNQEFLDGVKELSSVLEALQAFNVPTSHYRVDLSIVRGLDYYTGTVYETELTKYPEIGSVCSGGRYDNLCQYYTERNLPGVGISIGLSRLFFQLQAEKLLPKLNRSTATVLVVCAEKVAMSRCMQIATKLRSLKINCEIYLEEAKLSKQVRYASQLGIPFVLFVGSTELENNSVTLKNMVTQSQDAVDLERAIAIITWEGRH